MSNTKSDWFSLPSKPRVTKRLLLGLSLLYLPVTLLLFALGVADGPFLYDFAAYYSAAERVATGAPLYAPGAPPEGIPWGMTRWLYPPVFVLVFLPFLALDAVAAGVVWNAAALTAETAALLLLVRRYLPDAGRRTFALSAALLVSFAPTVTWLKAGQVSGVLAAGLLLAGLSLDRDRETGALAAVVASVKPFFAPAGLYLLRRPRRLLGAVLGASSVLLVGLLVFGVDAHLRYLDVLAAGKGWGAALPPPSTWNTGEFQPFYLLGPYRFAAKISLLVGVLLVGLVGLRRGARDAHLFALGVAIVPLAAPTTNTLALNALVPVLAVAGLVGLRETGSLPWPVVVSYLLLTAHPYTVEFLGRYSATHGLPTAALTPLLPLLQPALLASALLVGWLSLRIMAPESTESERLSIPLISWIPSTKSQRQRRSR